MADESAPQRDDPHAGARLQWRVRPARDFPNPVIEYSWRPTRESSHDFVLFTSWSEELAFVITPARAALFVELFALHHANG